jgi:purine nucleosidase
VKLLIDTDTGVDDAMGVVLALQDPAADVVGITTVFGNVGVDLTTANTLKIVELLGRTEVPVARGAGKGLLGEPSFVPWIHGDDGVGNANLEPPTLAESGESAVALISRLAREHSGELVVVALGPLTNVALALAIDPQLGEHLHSVVWMGGAATVHGNVGPFTEADAGHDPEAAQMVIEAPVELVMVGLDVTDRSLLLEADLEAIAAVDVPAAQYLAKITPFYIDFYSTRLGFRACAMHSALTVAIAVDPTLVTERERVPLSVELNGTHTRGMTVADRRADTPAEPNAEIVLDCDLDRFKREFIETVTRA